MDFLLLALGSFYLILPGAAANIIPVLVKKMNFLNYPVDHGRQWNGKPIFGPNKTYRGFFFGILSAIVIAYVQRILFLNYEYFKEISIIDYSAQNFMILGFLIGFGALFGDLVKSFFKRRVGIGPGVSWFPWDQLDSLVGALLFGSLVFVPPWSVVLFLLVLVPLAHIAVKHFGYFIGINKAKW